MDNKLTKTEIDMLLQLIEKSTLPVNQTLRYIAPIMRKLNNQLKEPAITELPINDQLTEDSESSNLDKVG